MSNKTEQALASQASAIDKLVEIASQLLAADASNKQALESAKSQISELVAADENNASSVGTQTARLEALFEQLLAAVPVEVVPEPTV